MNNCFPIFDADQLGLINDLVLIHDDKQLGSCNSGHWKHGYNPHLIFGYLAYLGDDYLFPLNIAKNHLQ